MANRSQMSRYRDIEKILSKARRSGQRVTAEQLAKETGVSVRTIYRDMDALRDDFGAPIDYDESKKTYLLRQEWTFQELKLSEAELLQLAVASQMAREYRGTPIARNLKSLFRKLDESLNGTVSFSGGFDPQHISFYSMPPRALRDGVWEGVVKAVRQGKRIRFRYQGFGYEKAVEIQADPLHVACREGDWYMVAKRQDKPHPFIYAMSRIHKVALLPVNAEMLMFDPEAFFRGSTGRFVPMDGKSVVAKIRFEKDVAEFITEREWHPDQQVKPHKDGRVTLTRPFGDLLEARRWALTWGSAAKVMSPKELAEDVAAEARKVAKVYRK